MYLKTEKMLFIAVISFAALFLWGSHQAVSAAEVVVNLSAKKQVIDGFGASSAWCGALPDNVMNSLYGDLGYSILRLRIEEGIGDNWKTGNFNSWKDELSNAKKASAKGAIVFASPWNPPKSMQENFTKSGDASAQRLKYDKYTEYVDYLNAYVKYMKDNGVDLYAVSVQNEPDYAQDWNWWTPAEMLNFMKTNAGSINCRVMAPESFQYLKNMSDPILNDATAFANVDILGFHLYGTAVNQFAYPLFEQKGRPAGKKAWMTEHYFDTDNIGDCVKLMKELHDCMVTGNMNGYVYWWITWPNGLAEKTGTIFKRAYVLGQFAKHVRPGYYRVDATATPATNVYVSAYCGSDKMAIVAVNTGTGQVSQKFTVQNGTVSQFSAWATTPGSNMAAGAAVPVSGGSFTATLPGQSITTFVGSVNGLTAAEPRSSIETVQQKGYGFTAGFSDGNIVVSPRQAGTVYNVAVYSLNGQLVSVKNGGRGISALPVQGNATYLVNISANGNTLRKMVSGF